MKINIPFGTALTCIAKVPPEARLRNVDPFKQKSSGMFWALLVALLITAFFAWLSAYGIFLWWLERR